MRYVLAFAILLAAPACAEPSVFQLYAEGKYDASAATALARNDSMGFADAARAVLAEEASRDQPCLECLERAEGYARQAIAADPKIPDGHIYLALSLGLESRIIGPLAARLDDYPGEAKRALDAALADDPRSAWALAGLGGWNIEVVRGAGGGLARWLYGATVEKGQSYFAAAFKAAPDNIAVRYQYALSLSGYDAERFRGEIEGALTRVVSGSADTTYVRLLQKRATELLALLKQGDRDAYAARVRKYEGYP